MARVTPINPGFTVLNGAGTGPNGIRIDVWMEYCVGQTDRENRRTWIDARFYAALNPSYTSATGGTSGLYAEICVDGIRGTGVENGSYSFTSPEKINALGRFSGYIPHSGEKTVLLEGRFTTPSSYITGGTIKKTFTLPAFSTVPEISTQAVILGGNCRVSWTPEQTSHTFRLDFSCGQWKQSVENIRPNCQVSYTYTGLTMPLEIARQFAGNKGLVTAKLTAYDGTEEIGSNEEGFFVTVPESSETRPRVTALLSPECDSFPNRYVQSLGRVRAQVTATDPLDAEITGYTVSLGGTTVSGTLSGILQQAGQVAVTVTATNSRGFTGSCTQNITVEPYAQPRFVRAQAFRSLSDGTPDPGGTFLSVSAAWQRAEVAGENVTSLRWRYHLEDGPWSEWESLPGDDFTESCPVPGAVLERDRAYVILLQITDSAGGIDTARFSIPVEQVYMHRTKNGMGLGGYCYEEGLDIHWPVQVRRELNGVCLRAVTVDGTDQIFIKSRFPDFYGSNSDRQVIFLFGSCGGLLIRGLLAIAADGEVLWEGTEGFFFQTYPENGEICAVLPAVTNDRFVLLSAGAMEVTA